MQIPNMSDIEKADLESFGALLPVGKYLATIVEVEEGESNNKPYIQVMFQVVGPADYAGKKVRDRIYLTNAALPISKAKLEAISFDTSTDRPFSQSDFVGRGAMLTIVHRSGTTKEGLPRIYMDVQVWAKVGEGVAPTAPPVVLDPDDDIPF